MLVCDNTAEGIPKLNGNEGFGEGGDVAAEDTGGIVDSEGLVGPLETAAVVGSALEGALKKLHAALGADFTEDALSVDGLTFKEIAELSNDEGHMPPRGHGGGVGFEAGGVGFGVGGDRGGGGSGWQGADESGVRTSALGDRYGGDGDADAGEGEGLGESNAEYGGGGIGAGGGVAAGVVAAAGGVVGVWGGLEARLRAVTAAEDAAEAHDGGGCWPAGERLAGAERRGALCLLQGRGRAAAHGE